MAPMLITIALKKAARKAFKAAAARVEEEEAEEDRKMQEDSEFGVYLQAMDGSLEWSGALGGRSTRLSVLEWWVLHGERGTERLRRDYSCTFLFQGEVLAPHLSFREQGIQTGDVLQVAMHPPPPSPEEEGRA